MVWQPSWQQRGLLPLSRAHPGWMNNTNVSANNMTWKPSWGAGAVYEGGTWYLVAASKKYVDGEDGKQDLFGQNCHTLVLRSTSGHVSDAYRPSEGTGAPDSGMLGAWPQPPACGTVNERYRKYGFGLLRPRNQSNSPIITRLASAMMLRTASVATWPDATAWVGIALIVGSGLYLVWRESVKDARLTPKTNRYRR